MIGTTTFGDVICCRTTFSSFALSYRPDDTFITSTNFRRVTKVKVKVKIKVKFQVKVKV